jgi:hypothetical protein
MKYESGQVIGVHDFCWHAERRKVGRVAEIVETEQGKEKYGVSEPGIFLSEDLSRENAEIDLFIAQQFFGEEEIEPLTEEERCLVEVLLKLAEQEAEKSFQRHISYRVECLDNPLENRHPRSRKWAVNFYDSQNLFGSSYIVSDDFSELMLHS